MSRRSYTQHTRPIVLIGGARPNFMKLAPLQRALRRARLPHMLINTGQHFDHAMAGQFFSEFGLKADHTLTPSRRSTVEQMTDIMRGLETVFTRERPLMVIVVGDVNSTLCGAFVANKMGIPIAHVEAGLRSFNSAMPEETNRILVDHMSDLLFVTEPEGQTNLRREGIVNGAYFVGNIMMDALRAVLPEIKPIEEDFYFATIHRAENVDTNERLSEMVDALEAISKDARIYMPLHPRTKKMAQEFGLLGRIANACAILPPLSYRESIAYLAHAKLVLTDSGGVQEEASFLGTPCLTLRSETERPITVTHGTNVIAGTTLRSILAAYRTLKKTGFRRKQIKIPLWDGRTSDRIVTIIRRFIKSGRKET